MLDVYYSNQPLKFLKKEDKAIVDRVLVKIEQMRHNPITPDSKAVEGYREKLFRVRVGKYRILYEVDYEANKIGIVKIDKRSRAYQ
ncbi:type II toxin-antitoxin system RelE/ParE family toxin [Candidatus Woesearchaeota archaeon]|nr:type II toxin-antitoxin system RelE/ParE family toxin [Candidatus Woesearchaeota archaeon]